MSITPREARDRLLRLADEMLQLAPTVEIVDADCIVGPRIQLMESQYGLVAALPEARETLDDLGREHVQAFVRGVRYDSMRRPGHIYRCASPNCPGLPYPASKQRHPCPPGVGELVDGVPL